LFELGTANTNSTAYDFQDLVIALDLDGIVQAPDYLFPATATGSPDFTYPIDEFVWSMVRAAPGGSRIKGLAYWRYQDDAVTQTNRIAACIAATGTNPSWTNCTPGTVFTQASPPYVNTADMAMTDAGLHAVGWVAYDGSLVKYLVSFTKDNGLRRPLAASKPAVRRADRFL
jgi:hypothetical protein